MRGDDTLPWSLALASLNHTYRNLVPTFPQRSPPWLLTAAACGGLRSAPDCRTRRALLHLSYSCAPPILISALVTHAFSPPLGTFITSLKPAMILSMLGCGAAVPARTDT